MKDQKTASERRKERDSFTNNNRFQEAKVPLIVRKYFIYDNERISGIKYMLRIVPPGIILYISLSFFNFLMIPAILLLSYIQSVIAYKRAKSIATQQFTAIFFAIWGLFIFPIQLFLGGKLISADSSFIVVTLPHLILLFSNQRKSI